jgi:carboxymethylenebutenolidase
MLHVYHAGHAFNRDVDPKAYDADSARLAHRRTIAFFAEALANGGPP